MAGLPARPIGIIRLSETPYATFGMQAHLAAQHEGAAPRREDSVTHLLARPRIAFATTLHPGGSVRNDGSGISLHQFDPDMLRPFDVRHVNARPDRDRLFQDRDALPAQFADDRRKIVHAKPEVVDSEMRVQ